MNYLSLWVSLYFLYILYNSLAHAVSLQTATLVQSTLSTMAAGG